jgi:hypothetical protein
MLNQIKEQYIVDKTGLRTAVLLDINDFNTLLTAVEELESIKAYDSAKNSTDKSIPFEQAISEIEKDC